MSDGVNTKSTADVMLKMARTMRDRADEMEFCAKQLLETGQWDYAGDAMSCIQNMFLNLRLDLLVTRPIREFEKDKQKSPDRSQGESDE